MGRILTFVLAILVAAPALAETHLAAVLRQNTPGSGWSFLENAEHGPTNIAAVAVQSNGKLRIYYTWPLSKVGAFSVTVDETFAASGLTVGASVGMTYTDLFLYAPFDLRLTGLTPTWGSFITTGDNWFSVDSSTALIDGRIKVTHPSMPHSTALGPPITISQIGTATVSVFVRSQTRTGFVIEAPPAFWVTNNLVSISRGTVRVRPQDVASPNGNLWFLGVGDLQ